MSQNVRYQLLEPAGVHSCDSSSGTFIGEGAYGVVYKALDKQTGKIVALKKIRAETEFDGISPATVREITLLTHLVHENVVKLENVILDRDRMSLIFELLDMDLKKYLDQLSGELSPALIKVFNICT
jgi:serine/threonine protein kinase